MIKEQLPGFIKHTASHSPKIQVKQIIKEHLPNCIKHSASYSGVIKIIHKMN